MLEVYLVHDRRECAKFTNLQAKRVARCKWYSRIVLRATREKKKDCIICYEHHPLLYSLSIHEFPRLATNSCVRERERKREKEREREREREREFTCKRC